MLTMTMLLKFEKQRPVTVVGATIGMMQKEKLGQKMGRTKSSEIVDIVTNWIMTIVATIVRHRDGAF